MKLARYTIPILLWLGLATPAGFADEGRVELGPRVFKTNDALAVEFWSGQERVGLAPAISPAGIQLRFPGDSFKPARFKRTNGSGVRIILGPTQVGNLILKLQLKKLNPSLIERT